MSIFSPAQTADAAASEATPVVQTVNITKRFPGVVANEDVSISILRGAFHAIIGENGAGKSTLLNILYGRYMPDSGQVRINGEDVTSRLHSPSAAIQLGIGLVSQHYALIPALTVLENVILGSEPTRLQGVIDARAATVDIERLADQLELSGLDLRSRAERLSVAAQQKVEILKALYRKARILLLDEPTATLAPQEVDALFRLLHSLNEQSTTIVFVTHKLREVIAHSTAVSVLRGGRNAGDFVTSETSSEVLLERMIGVRAEKPVPAIDQSDPELMSSQSDTEAGQILSLSGLCVSGARGARGVENASLELYPGEVLGVAGVDGSGQRELSEAIVGLRPVQSGTLHFHPGGEARSLAGLSVRERQMAGISYIPEDRHRSAMILDCTIAENYLLGHEWDREWGGGILLHTEVTQSRANAMISGYDVRVGKRDSLAMAGDLSGGNQQKIVIARALDATPRVLIACQPTRGLDTGATQYVYGSLRSAARRGMGVLLFSLDLDEILELSDRIAVMFNGRIAGVLKRDEATAERIGALMTGSHVSNESSMND